MPAHLLEFTGRPYATRSPISSTPASAASSSSPVFLLAVLNSNLPQSLLVFSATSGTDLRAMEQREWDEACRHQEADKFAREAGAHAGPRQCCGTRGRHNRLGEEE